jgi:hypothetical protein
MLNGAKTCLTKRFGLGERCQNMDDETVWVGKKFVRPRLSPDELWLMYRLIDSQYWVLRRHPHPFWDLEKVCKLRRKLLRLVNRCRTPKRQISLRERVY